MTILLNVAQILLADRMRKGEAVTVHAVTHDVARAVRVFDEAVDPDDVNQVVRSLMEMHKVRL